MNDIRQTGWLIAKSRAVGKQTLVHHTKPQNEHSKTLPMAHRRVKASATTRTAEDTRIADQFDNVIGALHLLAGGPGLSMQPHPHLHLILPQPAHQQTCTDRQTDRYTDNHSAFALDVLETLKCQSVLAGPT